jgi:hypothetical protein
VKSAQTKLGEIVCTLTLPYEAIKKGFNPPTIAEVPTVWLSNSPTGYGLLYRFLTLNTSPVLWRIDIYIPHTGYEKVRRALEEKYGSATKTDIQLLQNLYGARVAGRNLTWHKGNFKLILIEFFSRNDVSAVFYRLERGEEVIRERKISAENKALKDM